ncbi:hypothetical protein REJC140_00145 [Pseudorhizobium endolithicum]|uniref:Uncharacterized protein n=1 Tax=Pseudorhizobium endolithicum TaxID=1191678 RepID=A0ABN7JDR2_9HYPH|nr:hypothetical protein [Pseudorhizobium endolithicum]CAD7023256.1 hypothetical protein REJC140_00145 [Pseudorhizobium endolithicum]
MQQLSMFDLITAPLVPLAAPVPTRPKLSPWQIEQRDNRLARFAYRDTLPSDDAGMLNEASAELRAYDVAVRNADYDGMVASGNRLRAIGEHAFGLTQAEAEKGGPPDGNGRFFCLYDAWDWMSAALAATDGEIPLFGQKGRFEIEIAGCRVDFTYSGIFGICGGEARVIDWEKPFLSETGYRSFQVCPDDYVIAAAKLDCKGWLERVCLGQLTEGGKRKFELTRAWPPYARSWRDSRAFAEKYARLDGWSEERLAEHEASQRAALEQMAADGIDPDEVWRTRR